jgi:hypothetical protein
LHFLNQGLTNQAKEAERDKYRIYPRCSARVMTPRKQEDDKSKGSFLKILHYHNKFWKVTPAGYLIKITDIHFSEDPNKSASKSARAARMRDKIYKETNRILNNLNRINCTVKWINKEENRLAKVATRK